MPWEADAYGFIFDNSNLNQHYYLSLRHIPPQDNSNSSSSNSSYKSYYLCFVFQFSFLFNQPIINLLVIIK